jgi:hypothetical protein
MPCSELVPPERRVLLDWIRERATIVPTGSQQVDSFELANGIPRGDATVRAVPCRDPGLQPMLSLQTNAENTGEWTGTVGPAQPMTASD